MPSLKRDNPSIKMTSVVQTTAVPLFKRGSAIVCIGFYTSQYLCPIHESSCLSFVVHHCPNPFSSVIPCMFKLLCKVNKTIFLSQNLFFRIRLNAETDLDIPTNYRSLSDYCATLGHKANHSFRPNAR